MSHPPSSSSSDSILCKIQCHCLSTTSSFSLPLTAFPLKSAICLCNSCRHQTGHLLACFAVIPLPLPDSNDALWKGVTCYDSSENVHRYFCSTCGAHVLVDEVGVEWEVCSGLLSYSFPTQGNEGGKEEGRDVFEQLRGTGGVMNRAVLFTEDTKDGGAIEWINEGTEEGLWGRRLGHRDSGIVTEKVIREMKEKAKEVMGQGRGDVLKGRCHCGDVQIEISSPDGGNKEKYAAGLCACETCRTAGGFEVVTWFTVPKGKVKFSDGRTLEGGEGKELRTYKSSEKALRRFCKRCGAAVSYDPFERDSVDLAPGLFDAPEGSRAENWLEWNKDREDVGFAEEAVDKDFIDKVARGVRKTTRT